MLLAAAVSRVSLRHWFRSCTRVGRGLNQAPRNAQSKTQLRRIFPKRPNERTEKRSAPLPIGVRRTAKRSTQG